MSAIGYVSGAPHDHHKNSDERKVSIAIGHGLIAYLNDSDYRYQRSQIPEPTGHDVRASTAQFPDENTHREKEDHRHSDEPHRPTVSWIGIKKCETCGPKSFPYVRRVRVSGICEPSPKRINVEGLNGVGSLGNDGDYGAPSAKSQQEPFFKDEASEWELWYRESCLCSAILHTILLAMLTNLWR